jgi:hypothetical protein
MIMTDGEWNYSTTDLSEYGQDDRTIIFFKFEPGSSTGADDKTSREQGFMERYKPDEAHLIADLFDIPRILENLLIQIGRA